jgi:hypothetical protein
MILTPFCLLFWEDHHSKLIISLQHYLNLVIIGAYTMWIDGDAIHAVKNLLNCLEHDYNILL